MSINWCPERTYKKFDEIMEEELENSFSMEDLINIKSKYFVWNADFYNEYGDSKDLTLAETLTQYKKSVGVYMLWEKDTEHHSDDGLLTLRCVYVGKGDVDKRIIEHATKKWKDQGLFFGTFYECKNRIAKYIEQLIMDIYDMELNKVENPGKIPLLRSVSSDDVWLDKVNGHELANKYAEKNDGWMK